MTTLREAAQRLLNARDRFGWSVEVDRYFHALRDALAAAPQAEPMFWVRLCSDGTYEGPIHNSAIERVRKTSGAWSPLHLHPAPSVEQPGTIVDMVPPATRRDRWMYEQGRLAERDPRTHAAEQPGAVGLSDAWIDQLIEEMGFSSWSEWPEYRHKWLAFARAAVERAAIAVAQPAAPDDRDLYRSKPGRLPHLSVGAILRNRSGAYVLHSKGGIYSFMTGTLEAGETPEQCLHRELSEEMGATCRIVAYAGTSVVECESEAAHPYPMQKAIIWFDCELLATGGARVDDLDGNVVLIHPDELGSVAQDRGRWPHGLIAATQGAKT